MQELRLLALLASVASIASCEALIDTIAYPECDEDYEVCVDACEGVNPDRYDACVDGCEALYQCCIEDD